MMSNEHMVRTLTYFVVEHKQLAVLTLMVKQQKS